MPRIIDRLITTVTPGMFGNDIVALTDDDPVGVGVNLRRTPQRAGRDRVLVGVTSRK